MDILRSYLEGRTQRVSIRNILSNLSELIFGVPQGSVLGPLIFCIYTLPICSILRHHNIQYSIYADDTQLYCSFYADGATKALDAIMKCLSDIRSWMVRNKLKLNDDKTEFLVVSSRKTSATFNCSVKIGDTSVSPSTSCRNLGVIFDRNIALDKHISSVCRSTLYHLRSIGSIRYLITQEAAAQLVHSLVTSRLDYCNSLLYGLPDSLLSRLQRVQNVAARIVTRAKKFDHMQPILRDLHWLPVKYRIVFKVLLLTYRALHGTAPAYLAELLSSYHQTRTLRSSSQMLLCVPKTKLKTYGQCFFNMLLQMKCCHLK